jgi:hypothetical protein
MDPLLPAEALPVVNESVPLAPFCPALALRMLKAPLSAALL